MYNYAQLILKDNIDEAIKYFKIAADNGNVMSMYNYAVLIKKDNKSDAIHYFNLASSNGNLKAKEYLQNIR